MLTRKQKRQMIKFILEQPLKKGDPGREKYAKITIIRKAWRMGLELKEAYDLVVSIFPEFERNCQYPLEETFRQKITLAYHKFLFNRALRRNNNSERT